MEKQNKRAGLTKKILLSFSMIFLLIIIYLYIFGIHRPFDGEITQDRPIMEFLCKLQNKCGIVYAPYKCSYKENIFDEKLKKWQYYNGCNSSTKGYETKNERGYIKINYCSCGGLM
jgi:hypothetical protein